MNPLASVVNAEVDTLECEAALYDARFARSMLLGIGLLFAGIGFYHTMVWLAGLGIGALVSGWYFQAFKIPQLERQRLISRRELGLALGRLGQNFPSE